MKRFILVLIIPVFLVSYYSCSKDKTDASSDCKQTDSLNTYSLSVKPIFDANCAYAGCHDATTGASGIVLSNYTESVKAAKSKSNFFCVIDHSCGPIMPQGSDKLEDSTFAKITAWKANCYAQ